MGNGEIALRGWRIGAAGQWCAEKPELLDALARQVVETIESSESCPYHRSRHALTYLTRVSDAQGAPLEVYVKVYNPPGRSMALKEMVRGGRAGNVVRMTAALSRAGFHTPTLLLSGLHPGSGRTIVASARAAGVALPDLLARWQGEVPAARKRMLLRALGMEVARLHRAGFIHGDLTPYNIFVAQSDPPRFIFLDHDRTRRGFPAGRHYRQLRNLVQLGRFDLLWISNTDRLRFFRAYGAGMGRARARRNARLLSWMLARRRRRDAR